MFAATRSHALNELADAIDDKEDAVSFGRQAMNLAPAAPDSAMEEDVKWLREMISRNAAAPTKSQRKNNRIEHIRDRRRERLPAMVQFVFEDF